MAQLEAPVSIPKSDQCQRPGFAARFSSWLQPASGLRWGLLSLVCVCAATTANAAEPGQWRHDYQQAAKDARATGRPMLLHFYADWCAPCRRMDREVLYAPELLEQFSDGVVAVKINSDRHQALVRRFGIRALPSDVILSPEGKVISHTEGFQPRTSYLRRVTIAQASYARKQLPVNEQADPGSEETLVTDDSNRSSEKTKPSAGQNELAGLAPLKPLDSVPVEKLEELVGLDSYSPVALWNWRQWRKGKPEFKVEYRGITYFLADEKELKQFEDNPRRFAPQLLGCDPVILAQTDRAIPGSTQYGAYFDGHLYLFATKANRDVFKTDPYRFSRTRHAIKLDDVRDAVLR